MLKAHVFHLRTKINESFKGSNKRRMTPRKKTVLITPRGFEVFSHLSHSSAGPKHNRPRLRDAAPSLRRRPPWGQGPEKSGDMTLHKRKHINTTYIQSVLMEENIYYTHFIGFRECAESNRLSCITWHYRCIPRQWSELNISWCTKNHVPLPLQSNTLHVVGSRVVRKCHECVHTQEALSGNNTSWVDYMLSSREASPGSMHWKWPQIWRMHEMQSGTL